MQKLHKKNLSLLVFLKQSHTRIIYGNPIRYGVVTADSLLLCNQLQPWCNMMFTLYGGL